MQLQPDGLWRGCLSGASDVRSKAGNRVSTHVKGQGKMKSEDGHTGTGAPETAGQRLQGIAVSECCVLLDPATISGPRWTGRHSASLLSAAFAELKTSIATHYGNIVPILVTQASDGNYKLIHGYRRLSACAELGLPVKSVVCKQILTDQQQFVLADAENRLRENPSVFELGLSYIAALEEGLFSSHRKLAAACGRSHTSVNQIIGVARLPTDVIDCCSSPLEIKPRHAAAISRALARDEKAALDKVATLRKGGVQLPIKELVKIIGAEAAEAGTEQRGDLEWSGRQLGAWEIRSDRLVCIIPVASISDDALEMAFKALLRRLRPSKVPAMQNSVRAAVDQLRLLD